MALKCIVIYSRPVLARVPVIRIAISAVYQCEAHREPITEIASLMIYEHEEEKIPGLRYRRQWVTITSLRAPLDGWSWYWSLNDNVKSARCYRARIKRVRLMYCYWNIENRIFILPLIWYIFKLYNKTYWNENTFIFATYLIWENAFMFAKLEQKKHLKCF